MKWCVFIAAGTALCAQEHVQVRSAVSAISEERIEENLETLVRFGERNRYAGGGTARGIGAARAWMVGALRSYSTRLQVRVSEWPDSRTTLHNVIAVLPGTKTPDQQILVTAHYDSMGGPGAADNGSGTVAMMEVARILSRYEFPKTLVFIGFDAEEGGLLGSKAEAQQAYQDKAQIKAVLNADIVGNDDADAQPLVIRVYAAGGYDLGVYAKVVGERYTPLLIEVMPQVDRNGRRSDHIPYQDKGFPAVRFVSPYEDVSVQHTPNDTIEKVSIPYTAASARVLAAVAASLALGLEVPTAPFPGPR